MQDSNPRPFEELVARELGEPVGRGERWLTGTTRDLAGIALSGGGIRSATFNLGLLQGLHRLRLLGGFDYLATVSGGGYIGAFWTRWRSRDGAAGDFPVPPDTTGAEARPVRHLREHSNFLTPRLGLFTVDTGRMVVAGVSSTLPSLLAALAVVMLAIFRWALMAFLLLGTPAHVGLLPGASEANLEALRWMVPATVMFVVYAGVLLWSERTTPSGIGRAAPVARWVAALVGAVLAAAAWGIAVARMESLTRVWDVGQLLPLLHPGRNGSEWGYLFAPAGAWLAAALVLVAYRTVTSRLVHTLDQRARRAAVDRTVSRLLLFAAGWTVQSALWCGAVLVAGPDGLPAAGALLTAATVLAGAFARVQKMLASSGARSSGGALMLRLRALLPQLLAYGAVLLAVVGLMAVAAWAGTAAGNPDVPDWSGAPARLGAVFGVALGIYGFTRLCLNPNEVGLHGFYKGRLVRSYLGASHAGAVGVVDEHADDDIAMADLPAGAPVQLVCCAANDLARASDIRTLQRGADSAVLSRAGFSVGSEWSEWDDQPQVPTLGAAITASGAAFNSLMGSKSIQYGPAVTFLATALGLRLGMWVPHPREMRRRRELLRAAAPATATSLDRGVAGWARSLRRQWWSSLGGASFYHELLGQARATSRLVHLSDGAHFENLGIYELVRRHCRFILASDCGQDGELGFEDFGNLVRKVRQDFGVDIRIDLGPLRPGADGRARQPMVAGDVFYPNGDTGVLLLFKPTLVGSEPADVQQYRAGNAAFPHETTLDQFYDEAQWESYRRLGEHAALSAFEVLIDDLPGDRGREHRGEVFARARREWLPEPSGYAERAGHISGRIAELEGLLTGHHCRPLLAEVYREAGLKTPAPEGESPAERATRETTALVASLDVVRRAVRLMEEVFETETLERNHGHPAYLGLLNYFARWANAPTVRGWWPVLKTLHTAPFVRFMESQFGLTAAGSFRPGGGAALARLRPDAGGFANDCWKNRHTGAPEDGGRKVVSYDVAVGGTWLQAGQLICDVTPRLVSWSAADFYIAPGLWGCGFGADFLRRLRWGAATPFLRAHDADATPEWMVVHIPAAEDTWQARKRMADEAQMYRAESFVVMVEENGGLTGGGLDLGPGDLPEDWRAGGGLWLVAPRDLGPAPEPAPVREAATAFE